MPFKSRSQWRACFASERRGQSWGKESCSQWAKGVSYKRLPEKIARKSKKSGRNSKKSSRNSKKSVRKSNYKSPSRRSPSRRSPSRRSPSRRSPGK
jgi:hypothetical protein